VQKEIYGQFENTFMMYLPRLCEHCLNPACVAACPSGAIYKREEDGIVLIDQDKCRGWRMCVSGCPYKKIYYNWYERARRRSASSAIRASRPASRRCARRPASGASAISACCSTTPTASTEAASATDEQDLYAAQLDVFLDPNDPAVIAQARARRRAGGLARGGARSSPVYKMAMEWKVALPAASGVPHAADGLVRAAAVADHRRRRTPGEIGHRSAACPTSRRCAFRCATSPTC
jgi:nitrate reductase beta subunit